MQAPCVRFGVAVDGSDLSLVALRVAFSLAAAHDCVTAVHVASPTAPAATVELERKVAACASSFFESPPVPRGSIDPDGPTDVRLDGATMKCAGELAREIDGARRSPKRWTVSMKGSGQSTANALTALLQRRRTYDYWMLGYFGRKGQDKRRPGGAVSEALRSLPPRTALFVLKSVADAPHDSVHL
jgi:hypothetical protein